MTRDKQARTALAELLLRGDLAGVSVEKLVMAGRFAREHRDELREFTGKVAAQLHRDGMIWDKISQELGVPVGTIYRWAQPHL